MKFIVHKADSRGFFDHLWLRTHHTFSFADYYDPERIHFGALRVLNDDVVVPGRGFDMHPHRNMEVVSIPLKGYLTHGDNIDNISTITPGDIQVMSAGRGIFHSEYNGSDTEELHFLQIWVVPDVQDAAPRYGNYDIRPLLKRNRLALFIAPDGSAPASIRQNAWFSTGTFDAGSRIEYRMHGKGNGVYVFVIEGEISILERRLPDRDGIGVWDAEKFHAGVNRESRLLFIEVPMI